PTGTNQRSAVGDDSAMTSPNEKQRRAELEAASVSTSAPAARSSARGRITSRTMRAARTSSTAVPPSHNTQRTGPHVSSAVTPSADSTKYVRSPRHEPRPTHTAGRGPRRSAVLRIVTFTSPRSRHSDSDTRNPDAKISTGDGEAAMARARLRSVRSSIRQADVDPLDVVVLVDRLPERLDL